MAFPVSDDYKAALAAGGRTFTQIDIILDDAVITSALPVTTGSVTIEANKSVRRHGTVTVDGLHDEIDPYGAEVAVYGGLYLAPGTPITNEETQSVQDDGTILEVVPMGIFGIEEPETTDDGNTLPTSFEIYDRAQSISQRRLPRPYVVSAGTNLGVAIQTLIDSRRPGLTYDYVTTTAVLPADIVLAEQADAYAEAMKMAASAGLEILFDELGQHVLRPIQSVDAKQVAWEYVEGVGSQLVKAGMKRTSDGVYSHGIATGETTDGSPSVRGDAYDDDPSSPTYWLGRFGDRPTWLRSPYIGSQAQADDAAAGLRNRTSGIVEGLSLTGLANYAVDADDPVLVTRSRLAVDAVYTFESATVTLGQAGTLSASTRTRRIV